MMTGNNKLILDEATMIAIMEEYLNRTTNETKPITVASVRKDVNDTVGTSFVVSVSS